MAENDVYFVHFFIISTQVAPQLQQGSSGKATHINIFAMRKLKRQKARERRHASKKSVSFVVMSHAQNTLEAWESVRIYRFDFPFLSEALQIPEMSFIIGLSVVLVSNKVSITSNVSTQQFKNSYKGA